MGIDQIGKKGPPVAPPASGVTGRERAETERPFEISATPAAPRAAALEAPRTALERLRAGEVDVNGYLDLKVDEATAHLTGLPAPELQAIRLSLRDRLESDPMLLDLVRTATHGAHDAPGDDG